MRKAELEIAACGERKRAAVGLKDQLAWHHGKAPQDVAHVSGIGDALALAVHRHVIDAAEGV